jgi:hypothetical protein
VTVLSLLAVGDRPHLRQRVIGGDDSAGFHVVERCPQGVRLFGTLGQVDELLIRSGILDDQLGPTVDGVVKTMDWPVSLNWRRNSRVLRLKLEREFMLRLISSMAFVSFTKFASFLMLSLPGRLGKSKRLSKRMHVDGPRGK